MIIGLPYETDEDIVISVDSAEDPPLIGDPVWVEITYNFEFD